MREPCLPSGGLAFGEQESEQPQPHGPEFHAMERPGFFSGKSIEMIEKQSIELVRLFHI